MADVVTHIAYQEECYSTADRCVAGIRGYIERGWDLSQVRGPASGPFVVVFRIEDTFEEHVASAASLASRPA